MQITNNTAYDIIKGIKITAQTIEDAMEQQSVTSVTQVAGLASGLMNQVVGQFSTAFGVTLDEAMIASSVVMLPATLTLTIGKTQYMRTTVSPLGGGPVVFTSSAPTVASVHASTGLVTGILAGEATITATVDGATDTCVVTVPANEVTLLPATLNVAALSTPQYVKATVTPLDAGAITYTSSAPTIASVNATTGLLTPLLAGETTITATCGGSTDTCVVTVTAALVAVTGLTVNFGTVELTGSMTDTTIVATVAPAGATNKGLIVTSADATAINTVSVNEGTGVVTAHSLNVTKEGWVSITTEDGGFTQLVKYNITAS